MWRSNGFVSPETNGALADVVIWLLTIGIVLLLVGIGFAAGALR